MARFLKYNPSERPEALVALQDPFFDELRDPDTRLPNGQPLPDLFNFTPEELHDESMDSTKLIPDWYRQNQGANDVNPSDEREAIPP